MIIFLCFFNGKNQCDFLFLWAFFNIPNRRVKQRERKRGSGRDEGFGFSSLGLLWRLGKELVVAVEVGTSILHCQ
jgi:hypothetical protein